VGVVVAVVVGGVVVAIVVGGVVVVVGPRQKVGFSGGASPSDNRAAGGAPLSPQKTLATKITHLTKIAKSFTLKLVKYPILCQLYLTMINGIIM